LFLPHLLLQVLLLHLEFSRSRSSFSYLVRVCGPEQHQPLLIFLTHLERGYALLALPRLSIWWLLVEEAAALEVVALVVLEQALDYLLQRGRVIRLQ
jgi:hypothetical protein